MSRVVCVPPDLLPADLDRSIDYFAVFRSSGRGEVSRVGTGLIDDVVRAGFSPSTRAWDFATFALAVSAADLAVVRNQSVDGWTRMLELQVALVEPEPFTLLAPRLEKMLRFLTGDYWRLSFIEGGTPAPRAPRKFLRRYDADCVSLLSGGMDSLVGGIDLIRAGSRPLFVSQMAKGDSETQVEYARRLGASERHIQWNHNIQVAHTTERSTRGRSIVFFAFAILAADQLQQQGLADVTVVVPENGFISLNVPLNAGRVGSLSTKTTHPVFLDELESIWRELELHATFERPYAYKTKGELAVECADRVLLAELVGRSTSCGRFGYYNYTHCGRCVPCLVRRSSFIRAGLTDSTSEYHFPSLRTAGRKTGANDIGAVAAAVLRHEAQGVRRLTGGQLTFAPPTARRAYEDVVARGLAELGTLLRREGVL